VKAARGAIDSGVGVDDRLLPGEHSAREIVNFRFDPRGWWSNDRGWEPQIPRPNGYAYPAETLAPVRFLAIWTRNQGGEVYYLFERGGVLQYELGNNNQGAAVNQVVLQEGRHIPTVAEPGTQLVSCGRFALLLNGVDPPIKFRGDDLVVPFGWLSPPPPPVVAEVDPDILASLFDAASSEGTSADATALAWVGPGPALIGDGNPEEVSRVRVRISFVSDSGSESPASAEVEVAWTTLAAGIWLLPTFGLLVSLPRGGDHVVATRIYRTKNLRSGENVEDASFYFAAQVNGNASDAVVLVGSDASLSIAAPDPQSSVTLPPGVRYGAVFDGRTWLLVGSRLIYSEANAPEQFSAFGYFELGGRSGDGTGLVAHEGRLYVFRARGVDVVEITEELGYRVGSLSGAVGTTASNTIRAVPGFGLVFLSGSGFYAVSGMAPPVRLSDPIADELRRVGAGSLARATADWSDREGEYWCHYPADGCAENLRGAVLHAFASLPDHPAWSLRHVTPTDADAGQFRAVVTAIATDPEGWFILGKSPVNTTTGSYPGVAELADLTVADEIEGSGLQVWSARPAAGSVLTVTAINPGESYEASQAGADPLESVWQSPWVPFQTRTSVVHVEVWFLNAGRPDVTFEFAVDGRAEWTAGPAVEMAPFETSGKSTADHVYATNAHASRRLYQGKWGTSKWREDRVVRVVFDVHPAAGACGSFSFRLRASDVFGILRYQVAGSATGIGTGSQRLVSDGVS
jgi:hypothetical protein